MERQKARWRKSEDVPDVLDARMLGVLQMTLKKLSHFMWRLDASFSANAVVT